MDVIPAIDLRGGKCVRLYMGDYDKETVYSDDPVEVARRWHKLGAKRMHVVDLDGARLGKPANLDVIGAIVKAVNIPVQVGGGIRTIATAESLLQLGVARVIFGTVAIENPELVAEACRKLGEAVVVSIDARDGMVAVRGWETGSKVLVADLVKKMAKAGVKRFVYTDIGRDGTLTEPNFEAVADLLKKTTLPIIVSGGVSSVEHIKRIKALGAEGAIVGKALYTGDLDLSKAIKAG